jgi:hypothetical protein
MEYVFTLSCTIHFAALTTRHSGDNSTLCCINRICFYKVVVGYVSESFFAFEGIVVTNDGNAILREIDIAHPAAKV